jgi:hypothetical protein
VLYSLAFLLLNDADWRSLSQGLIHIKNDINISKVTSNDLRDVNVILAVNKLDPTVMFGHHYNKNTREKNTPIIIQRWFIALSYSNTRGGHVGSPNAQ